MIDIAIPDYSNINTKETEKSEQIDIKISRMWKVRTKIVPVITGALAKINKILDQNLQLLPATELQKVTIMNNVLVYSTRYALG
jgi:hypothetical protein